MYKRLILFHRRLIVLIAVFAVVLVILFAQVGRLTISQGQERFAKATSRLHATSYLPTWRGKIIDRKGRLVAQDIASYDIAVDWDLITGDRANAVSKKRRKSKRRKIGLWKSISPEQRDAIVATMLPDREAELRHFWKIIALEGGVTQADLARSE